MTHQKQIDQKSGAAGTIVAGVAGAVVAAGAAVVASRVLSDEKNRKVIKDALSTAKDKVIEYGQNMKQDADAYQAEVVEKVEAGKEQLQKEAKKIVDDGKNRAKKSVAKASKDASK
jgi:vacuolar-type H+-ATPase subunit H